MKGIIVEIKQQTAAVLSDDGRIVKIPNDNYQIGQEVVYMKKQINFKNPVTFISIAAGFLLISSLGLYSYFSPYTYVSLDVNPSIEYSLNRYNKVLSATGVNDDGTELLQKLDLKTLKNKNIDDALSLTIEQLLESGYLMDTNSGLLITTSSDDMEKANELVEDLEEVATEELKDDNPNIVIQVEAVGAARVEEARKLGVTPGKLNLVEKLMEAANVSGNSISDNSLSSNSISNNIIMSEWLNRSVKDILAETNRYREQNRESEQNKNEEQEDNMEQEIETEQNENKEQEDNSEQEIESEQNKHKEQEDNSEQEIETEHNKNKNQQDNSEQEIETEHNKEVKKNTDSEKISENEVQQHENNSNTDQDDSIDDHSNETEDDDSSHDDSSTEETEED